MVLHTCSQAADTPCKPSPLTPLYQGPFEVIDAGPKFFTLRVGSQLETVSVDRLKPYLGEDDVTPAEPAPRGRPRRPAGPASAEAKPPPDP
jgi:hypothetical protein